MRRNWFCLFTVRRKKSLTALFSLSLFSIMSPFIDSEIRRRCQYNGSTKSIQSDGNYQPYVDDHFLNCCPCYEGLQYLTQRPALKWDHCQHSSRQTQYLSVSKVHTVLKNKYAYCIHGLWVHVSPIILCWLALSHRLSEQLLKNLSEKKSSYPTKLKKLPPSFPTLLSCQKSQTKLFSSSCSHSLLNIISSILLSLLTVLHGEKMGRKDHWSNKSQEFRGTSVL